jgi:Acyl-CoA oxidase
LLKLQNQAQSVDQLLDLDVLDKALQVRALHLITNTVTAYNLSKEPVAVKDNEIFQ